MASSSVSQESLDMDDFDTMARRNRIRTHRGRAMPHRSGEREGGGDSHDRDGRERDHQNGDTGDGAGHAGADHESPTRSAAARIKDKQRSRPNHMHKGKLPKDKRKLREKRRSTGVVHLPSTESTGDSLDDDDDDDDTTNHHETKKNTTLNESTGTPHSHPHPHSHSHSHSHLHHGHSHQAFEARHSSGSFSTRGNKSPSDLEADLEDNQDYDSTVSHSETNLTLIGRSESSDAQMSSGLMSRQPPSTHAKFSPEASRASSALRYGGTSSLPQSSDTDSTRTPPSSVTQKSSVSSLVSRYAKPEPALPRETDLPNRDIGMTRVTGYSAVKDAVPARTEVRYGGYLPSRFQEPERESSGMGSNSSGSTTGGSTTSVSHLNSSRLHFQAARPFVSQHNTAAAAATTATSNINTTINSSASAEKTAQIERQLEREKEENKKMQQQLEQKDRRIAELERQIAMLNKQS
ncbi:lateral signaling target protein 2 homolog isoform X2 [Littorina saxatilis]|uniref:lateral signaling target protein 2 homolog isoform X2 n=1 Tax=Littorina saxatilis TaxID=31220 RepID=UPI0038B42F6E